MGTKHGIDGFETQILVWRSNHCTTLGLECAQGFPVSQIGCFIGLSVPLYLFSKQSQPNLRILKSGEWSCGQDRSFYEHETHSSACRKMWNLTLSLYTCKYTHAKIYISSVVTATQTQSRKSGENYRGFQERDREDIGHPSATCGTQFSRLQSMVLYYYTKKVYVIFPKQKGKWIMRFFFQCSI